MTDASNPYKLQTSLRDNGAALAPALILFDIDATLITTSRAGIAAMGQAGRELFGADFNEHCIAYAGRLDPLIIADLLTAHHQSAGDMDIERFRAAYCAALVQLLRAPGVARPCPGVPELLKALKSVGRGQSTQVVGSESRPTNGQRPTLGLLTGNYPETGQVKLAAAGIDIEQFTVRVWGCDSPHAAAERWHLPAVALQQLALLHSECGRAVNNDGATAAMAGAARVSIIGDTVHDIECAKRNGMRALGVATGSTSREELKAAGADLALADLSDTELVLNWLMQAAAA